MLTRGRLRGPTFRRLFEDVYVAADVPVDLALRSRAAHLLVAGRGALAGYSAAEILGVVVLAGRRPGRGRCSPGGSPAAPTRGWSGAPRRCSLPDEMTAVDRRSP